MIAKKITLIVKLTFSEGYVNVSDVLSFAESSGLSFTESNVRSIVESDKKGRFKLRTHGTALQIKATQGHSFNVSTNCIVTHLCYLVIQ